jgi:hypothetical protein
MLGSAFSIADIAVFVVANMALASRQKRCRPAPCPLDGQYMSTKRNLCLIIVLSVVVNYRQKRKTPAKAGVFGAQIVLQVVGVNTPI